MNTAVLIVESGTAVARVVRQWSDALACQVESVSSCDEALAVLRQHTPDVLITVRPLSAVEASDLLEHVTCAQVVPASILVIEPADRALAVDLMARYDAVCLYAPLDAQELKIHLERCIEKKRFREQVKHERVGYREALYNAEQALFFSVSINALLETGLASLSLKQQVEVALDIVLALPSFASFQRGAIFLLNESTEELELVGHRNMPEPLQKMCARLPLGRCLCGRAGQGREALFVSCVDERHEMRYEGMPDHGHYCVPIAIKTGVLGVLNLFVHAGYLHDEEEEALLVTIANVLALIFEHRQIEDTLKRAEERLRHLAYHDQLTGLRNRQSFHAVIDKIFFAMQSQKGGGRRRDTSAFCGAFLAVLDIDHFKQVNDTYGHLLGDEVLVLFARHINDCFRDQDAAFRFGGEEFVVLLSDISEEVAAKALDRFRQRIATFDFPKVGRVTVSIGVVEIVVDELVGDLIAKADKALYYSKKHGRNQLNFYRTLVASGHLEEELDHSSDVDLW